MLGRTDKSKMKDLGQAYHVVLHFRTSGQACHHGRNDALLHEKRQSCTPSYRNDKNTGYLNAYAQTHAFKGIESEPGQPTGNVGKTPIQLSLDIRRLRVTQSHQNGRSETISQ